MPCKLLNFWFRGFTDKVYKYKTFWWIKQKSRFKFVKFVLCRSFICCSHGLIKYFYLNSILSFVTLSKCPYWKGSAVPGTWNFFVFLLSKNVLAANSSADIILIRLSRNYYLPCIFYMSEKKKIYVRHVMTLAYWYINLYRVYFYWSLYLYYYCKKN